MSNASSLVKSSSSKSPSVSLETTEVVKVADAAGIPAPKPTAVAFCRAFKLHPATRDRSPKRTASRIAQALNATLGHESNGGTFWTGSDVMALAAREGITLPQ